MTEQGTSGGCPTTGPAGRSARAQAAYWSRRAEQSHRDYLEAREKAGRWRVGAEGEEAVAQVLGSFPLELAALHDRLLEPGRSKVNLDHVVVTHAGVFVLDTKSWSGDVSVTDDTLWVHSESRRYGRNKDLATVGGYADVMAARLRVQVTPVLVLAREHHQGLEPAFVAGVHVVPAQRLREWFLRRPVVMDDVQSRSLLGVCAREFPDATTTTVVSRPAPARGYVPVRAPGHARRSRAPRVTGRASPRRLPAARRGVPVQVLLVLMCVLLGPPLAMGFGSVVASAVTAVVARPAPSPPTPSHQASYPATPPASTRPAHPPTGTNATP